MSYLNKTKIKEALLFQAEKTRAHRFERVSGEVFEYLEGVLKIEIDRLVRLQPSKGKTIYPAVRVGSTDA